MKRQPRHRIHLLLAAVFLCAGIDELYAFSADGFGDTSYGNGSSFDSNGGFGASNSGFDNGFGSSNNGGFNDGFGVVDSLGAAVWDATGDRIVTETNPELLDVGRTMLQTTYADIAAR